MSEDIMGHHNWGREGNVLMEFSGWGGQGILLNILYNAQDKSRNKELSSPKCQNAIVLRLRNSALKVDNEYFLF